MMIKIIQILCIFLLTFSPVVANLDYIPGTWIVTINRGSVEWYKSSKKGDQCYLWVSPDGKEFIFSSMNKSSWKISGQCIKEDE